MYTADGSLVFQFNGVTPVENYNYTNNDAVLSAGGVKQQPWKTCKRESDMEFHNNISNLGTYRVPQLKRFLLDAGLLKPNGNKPDLIGLVSGYLLLPWGTPRQDAYLKWLSGSTRVVEGALVGEDESSYGLVPFTPPLVKSTKKRKHTGAVSFDLNELQRTLHRHGNHPYVSARQSIQTAFWVVPFDRITATPWQCLPCHENLYEESDTAKVIADVRTQVNEGQNRFVSLTLDKQWAVFSSLKSVLQKGKAGCMILEIDLTKVGLICNLSTEEAGLIFSLDTAALSQCWSSSEILVSAVPDDALTGHGWLISPASAAGSEAIKIRGSDRILNPDGSIMIFGRYGLWREAFSAFLAKKTSPVEFFNELRCIRPDE